MTQDTLTAEQTPDMLRNRVAELEAQLAIRSDAERFLRSVVDNVPVMIFVKGAERLQFVRVNKTEERVLGLTCANN